MFYEVMVEGMGGALTYDFDEILEIGQVTLVPLGKKVVPGVVVKKVAQPTFTTKPIFKILYSMPLPSHLVRAAQFVNDYYLMANAVSLILPNGVEKKRRKTEQMFGLSEKTGCGAKKPEIKLNKSQKNALQGLQEARSATKLLYGITGSGKTNIYLKMAENALKRQKSTILLVPEIALTGQLVRIFQEFFGDKIVLIHSKQTEAERHLIFDSLLKSAAPKIVIGPRSALFAPLKDLGLIIIDEEHESSYYQENSPKYSTIRVASFIAQELKIPLILGSATPTVEDFYLAKKLGSLVELTEKAKDTAVKPTVKVIDFKDRTAFSKSKYFSTALIEAIKKNLEQGQQSLIFHNRRGSSPLTICENCGEEILCPHCFLPLTLHADTYELVCHTCGFNEKVPVCCPKCQAPGLIHKGFGTKLIESELKKLFPKAKIQRFDADSKVGLEEVYDEVKAGGVDILVGTQTLAKGLDLPKLATVGVVQADAGLNLPDFVAEERTFQLLTQVMGRVGRGHIDTAEVFIQTFRPEHPVLKFATMEDYKGFYEYEIRRRRKAGFPPYSFILKLEITMKTEATVLKKVRELSKKIAQDDELISSPPMPAFHERTDKGYTWQMIVRSKSRKALVRACDGIDKNFKITLDPPRLL
jgi:primosomal protein N' (replication factor Y) (superfamily II helicase)